MAIIDVVAWSAPQYTDRLYAWRFPETELSTWTQLIVNESQEAVLYRSGSMDGPFGPGRHVLKTENLPVLKNLLSLPFGRSPFTAEVWFVNKAIPLDVKWGTREPILVKDPQYHIMIPVLARGQYGVQIENARKFLVKLVGAMPDFDRERLQDYFRGLIITVAKTVVAREIVKKQVSILEISAHLTDLSAAIQESLREALEEFGLKLVNFFVNGIDVQEGDQSIETLRAALAKRAEMSIVGYTYQQERSLNALEGAAGFTAAENGLDGSNNMAAAAVGLGVGFGVGGPLGGALGAQMAQAITPQLNAQPAVPPTPAPAAAGSPCPKCQSPVAAGAKFCPSCGSSTASATPPCVSCGSALASGAAFCSNCGTAVAPKCQNCGAKLAPGAKFCGECGTPTKPGAAP
ncbi:MAG: hypothetical protein K0R89_938 [Ramlibacter sp.]|jgi:membrane protease subunit (stomatin/prohibitin family)|nr:hypothetical protein [Ramlibacter sp.]